MTNNILQSWQDQWPIIKSTEPLPTGEGVIDQGAFNTIEVAELFDTVNHASTIVGQSVLFRSLAQPSDSFAEITAKQAAVKEIQDNPTIRENIENIIARAANKEKSLYSLLFGRFSSAIGSTRQDKKIEGYGYKQYRRGVSVMTDLVGSIYASGEPKSAYLNQIFNKITTFSESRTYSLMLGPVYNTERGFNTKSERKGSFIPATIFKPKIFKPLLISLVILGVWVATKTITYSIPGLSFGGGPVSGMLFAPFLLAYFPVIGSYDRDNCIIPLRDEYKKSEDLGEALDALGQLDELLSIVKFAEKFPSHTVLPTFIESESHSIDLADVKNPVLGLSNEHYVGNDFSLDQEKLVIVTGPNSGGKTAFCKTMTQMQLLAQAGHFIPAQSATLSIADHIFYQAPDISHLDDGEGRFGTELKRTKAIFLASSAKSLVILDELSEGTTFEEKMESSTNVLDGFFRKGCNTILITHNHQLVDVFMKKKQGIAKQVEFVDELPTYKLVTGISRNSHADRVAKKIGFSKQDIDNYLAGEQ